MTIDLRQTLEINEPGEFFRLSVRRTSLANCSPPCLKLYSATPDERAPVMTVKKLALLVGVSVFLFLISFMIPVHRTQNRNATFNWDIPQAFAMR